MEIGSLRRKDPWISRMSAIVEPQKVRMVDRTAVLLYVPQTAYVTEVRLNSDRGGWGCTAPLSCPNMDLDVIEEYLQEHSLEVQPARVPSSPPANMGQLMHSHPSTRITGEPGWKNTRCDEDARSEALVCLVSRVHPTVNSWSGQHPYRWHCGSHTPQEEYEGRALRPEWPSQHDKQWVSSSDPAVKRKDQQLEVSHAVWVSVSESCCLFV